MCVCVYLDLVGVHAGVGDQDVDVLQPLGLVHSDLLVQQETWAEHQQKRYSSQSDKTAWAVMTSQVVAHLRPGRSR